MKEQETQSFVPVPYPSISSMPKQLEVETSKDTTKRVSHSSPAKVPKKKAKLLKPSISCEDLDFDDFVKTVNNFLNFTTCNTLIRL